jgi:nucleotide-binding universal stress UspA family protein
VSEIHTEGQLLDGGGELRGGALSVSEVLFATDFSIASHVAGLYARALATQLNLPLTVAHVFLRTPSAQDAEALTGKPSEQRIAVKRKLEVIAGELSPPDRHASHLLCEGDPAPALAQIVAGRPGILLVLGTHGGSRMERRLLGSTAEQVLTIVSCPTLTVGPKVSAPRDADMFKHVLYATDCSQAGSRAAPLACALASRFSGQLKVISVIDEAQGPTAEILANFDFTTRQELASAPLPGCSNFADSRSVSDAKDAERVILRTLGESGSDLLVLAVRQHDHLGFMESNSTAFRIIAKAPRPVLTITDRVFSS